MTDHFEIFSIARTFGINASHLERTFHALQNVSHPDRHVGSDLGQRGEALTVSSEINRAYRTLRDPLKRSRYLLGLYGYTVSEQKQVPTALLMLVMDSQEKIMELELTADPGRQEALRTELRTVAEELESRRAVIDRERASIEQEWDSIQHPIAPGDLTELERSQLERISQLLAERAYIGTLHASVEAAREGRPSIIKH